MARRKPDPQDVPGLGVAAWCLLASIVDELTAKGVFTRQERADLIDRALSTCERVHEEWDHSSFETARFLLEHALRSGGRRRPARRKSPPR